MGKIALSDKCYLDRWRAFCAVVVLLYRTNEYNTQKTTWALLRVTTPAALQVPAHGLLLTGTDAFENTKHCLEHATTITRNRFADAALVDTLMTDWSHS